MRIEYINNSKVQLNNFSCENSSMSNYLINNAEYDHITNISKTSLVIDESTDVLIGYYTISITQLKVFSDLEQKNIEFPCFELDRLAVDTKYQQKGIGSELLIKIILDCIKHSKFAGGVFLVIRALNDKIDWYASRGFVDVVDLNYDDSETTTMHVSLVDQGLIDEYMEV